VPLQPLTEALRCVNHISTWLRPIDPLQLAVVVYDRQVQTPIPLRSAMACAGGGQQYCGQTCCPM
jgi:cell division FtsZ-interacting protein ZapD